MPALRLHRLRTTDFHICVFLTVRHHRRRLILLLLSASRYVPLNHTTLGDKNLPNMENASVFYLSGFQYIILAVVVTKGYPHKKPLYRNSKSPRFGSSRPPAFAGTSQTYQTVASGFVWCFFSCSHFPLHPVDPAGSDVLAGGVTRRVRL